jgi:hypothetical protein
MRQSVAGIICCAALVASLACTFCFTPLFQSKSPAVAAESKAVGAREQEPESVVVNRGCKNRQEEGAVVNRFLCRPGCMQRPDRARCSGCGCPRPGGLRGSALEKHNKLASEGDFRGQRLRMLSTDTTDTLLPQRHPIEEARIPGPKCEPAFHLRALGPPKRASDAPL